MAINISSNIFPLNNGPAILTHEDIYGKGGFVAIITTTDLPLINDHITPARRKEGMLVYDVTTEKYYRCLSAATDTNDANWTEENFGGSDITIGAGVGIQVDELENSYTISLHANIGDLNDVLGTSPSDGQVLTWSHDDDSWVPQNISIVAEGTDGMIANANSPFLVWTEEPSLTQSKTLIGDGIIGIDIEYTDNAHVLLFIEDNSITNNKLFDPTISGVQLGQDLFALTFGTGLSSPNFDYYDGSSLITLSIDFGTGVNQVARGNHTHELDELTDVTVTTATEGDVLVYAGTEGWVNSNFIYGGSASSF
jgi:hypothetical protein